MDTLIMILFMYINKTLLIPSGGDPKATKQ